MSDERFDEDLRAVLVEEAPRAVPDDLRRRVAAIPTAHLAAGRPPGPAWRQPVPLSIGVLATLVVVIAVGIWRFGPPSQPGVGPGVGSAASPSPTTVPSTSPAASANPAPSPSASPFPSSSPSPSPSRSEVPSPSPSESVGACRAIALTGQILGWGGAAGSRIADVEITNATGPTCLVRGTPGLQLVDASGRVLIDSLAAGPDGQPHVAPGDPTLELAPGGRVRTEVQVSNYCGAVPTPPITIAMTLPSGGGRLLVVPGPGVSSAEAVPPCLGSTASNIAMNGWRR